MNFFSVFENILSFKELNVLPAFLMFVIAVITIFYNKLLSKNGYRTIFISFATFFSIIAILSVNFILTFIAIEMLSIFCFLLVLIATTVKRRVAISYFLIHSFAGILMLIAIMMNYSENNTFVIQKNFSNISLKEVIMLTSLAINTALFPFTQWYTKTYSRVDSFSLIILSVITTKTAFFILWKIIPGSTILFEIGFATLVIATFFALITTNIVKFLLLTSIASMGFATIGISYHNFLVAEGISAEINSQLVWYIASSAISICGFLTLYGFITNNECKNNSFSTIKDYFQHCGSSVHFIIPSIVFGICLASFPFTASFIAKTNITKFFVEEELLYYVLKASSIAFIMFAIKLILPVCHSVSFFKLDVKGVKLSIILYSFVFLLVVLNVVFLLLSKIKYNIFGISVEFFSFVAYTAVAGVILISLDFALKATNAKRMIEVLVHDVNFFRRRFLLLFISARRKLHELTEEVFLQRKKLKDILVFSKISPSLSVFFVGLVFLVFIFFN